LLRRGPLARDLTDPPELADQVTAAEQAALERAMETLLRGRIGFGTKVRIVPPGTIERPQGKAGRCVVVTPRRAYGRI
jgi:hypothetical protein